jgi:hypothetical protein
MSEEIKAKAIIYWQDKLAKFFPTSNGPTNCEIEMFKAGYSLHEIENARPCRNSAVNDKCPHIDV